MQLDSSNESNLTHTNPGEDVAAGTITNATPNIEVTANDAEDGVDAIDVVAHTSSSQSNNDNDGDDAGPRHDDNSISNRDDNATHDEYEEEGEASPSYFMEGYTPLNFDMNALVMMNDDDSDDGFDGSEGSPGADAEMNGDMFSNGYYHMGTTPHRRVNGVKDGVFPGVSIPEGQHEDEWSDNDPGNEAAAGHDQTIVHFANNNDNVSSSAFSEESEEAPDDFRLLAEQALRGLEEEHRSTLESACQLAADAGNNSASAQIISTPDSTASDNENLQNNSPTFETTFPSLEETTNAFDAASSNETTIKSTIPAKLNSETNKSKPSSSKIVDVQAIQKAMQCIRIKSPELATTLDEGASNSSIATAVHDATDAALALLLQSTSHVQQQNNLSNHTIIPSGPLAAFRRSTPKAKAASAHLSRSATISEAVVRLWPLICFRRKMRRVGLSRLSPQQSQEHENKTLTIHILGADGVECSSGDLVRKAVGPFVRWMEAALLSDALPGSKSNSGAEADGSPPDSRATDIDSLRIEFSGPNMPDCILNKTVDLLPQSQRESQLQRRGFISATAVFQQREYHEDLPVDGKPATVVTPDLAIAFNAGIWGYDSWKPTIAHMCKSTAARGGGSDISNKSVGGTIFVITAYTLEECEDDAEVFAEVAEDVAAKRADVSIGSSTPSSLPTAQELWAPEPNPYSSRIVRKTVSAAPGRATYYENAAWQAWILGL